MTINRAAAESQIGSPIVGMLKGDEIAAASQVITGQLGFTHFGRRFSFHLSPT